MKKNGLVGLICAVPEEGNIILGNISRQKKKSIGATTCHEGKLGNVRVCCVVSGIGKTNAAHAATVLIQHYAPTVVINPGIGGAYPPSSLEIGDIALATEEIYADEGVMTKSGLEPLETIGLPLLKIGRKKYFNHYPLDKSLTKDALKAARSSSSKALAGAFATVSACTGTKKRADELFAKYGVICENMEGAAIAHICCMYDIPCIEIRGISNLVEDRDISKWDIQRAAANCQKAVIDFIGRLEHSSLLMRNRAEKGRDR